MNDPDINKLAALVHGSNGPRWEVGEADEPLKPSKNEMLALMASRLLTARHGAQHNKPDDRLPHLSMEVVQLADCLIRILDYCGGFGIDVNGAFWEKLEYNKSLKEGELVWCTGSLNDPD